MKALLLIVPVFIFMLVLVPGIYFYFQRRKERMTVLEKISGEENQFEKAQGRGRKKFPHRVLMRFGGFFKPGRDTELSKTRLALIRGAYRQENDLILFLGLKVLLAGAGVVSFLVLKFLLMKPMGPVYLVFFTVASGMAGFYLPNFLLSLKIESRKKQITKGFPDALDLMVVCVEAGMGLDAAISKVGEEIKLGNPVLSDEFRLLSLELRAGKLRRDALKNLALRTDIEDVNSLVTLLIQTDRFGTRIAQALRVYSDSMRVKRYQLAEELAAKLPTKLIFPLVLFILPSLFVVVLGPALIQAYRIFLGK